MASCFIIHKGTQNLSVKVIFSTMIQFGMPPGTLGSIKRFRDAVEG